MSNSRFADYQYSFNSNMEGGNNPQRTQFRNDTFQSQSLSHYQPVTFNTLRNQNSSMFIPPNV